MDNQKNSQPKRQKIVYASLGLIFGGGIGLIFGNISGNLSLGLIFGAFTGLLIGSLMDQYNKNKNKSTKK